MVGRPMSSGEIRIGIVGAGQIARTRHMPGFQGFPGVKVVGVCNRRRETAARVARDFDIPKIYSNWEDLVADPEVDAVVIGAWPYLHCPVTLAAFDAGKHVLTEARMAMNAREAQRMCDRAQESPRLTAMVVPSPYGLTGDAYMRSLIASGWLGTLREVHVHGLNDQLADKDTPLGWRQMTRYSGFNMLTLGILYETVLRWVRAGQSGDCLCVEGHPASARPGTGQEGEGRDTGQRSGLDHAGRRLVRRLSAEWGGLAR